MSGRGRGGQRHGASPSPADTKTAAAAPPTHDVTTVVMKNCEPLVSRPALAIDSRPGFECLSLKFSSSNLLP
jgi:hypothetical protein